MPTSKDELRSWNEIERTDPICLALGVGPSFDLDSEMWRSLNKNLRPRWSASLVALALSAPTWPVAALETLALQQCIEEALNNNPDLAALEARTAQASAAADEADAERWPEISVGGATQHATDPVRVRPATENNQVGVYARDLWRAH